MATSKTQQFYVKLLSTEGKIPFRATPGAVGYDVYAVLQKPLTILPGSRALVGTGLSLAPSRENSKEYYAELRPRSGLSVKGIDLGAGTIDPDYRGEIKVLLINNGTEPFEVKTGDRICQMIFRPVILADLIQIEELSETDRGTGGFGSTGTN